MRFPRALALLSILLPFAATPLGAEPGARFGSMSLVVGGSFLMGSKTGAPQAAPVHRALVSSFYLSTHLVTRGEYDEFVRITRYATSAEAQGGAYGTNKPGNYGYFLALDYRNPGFAQADDEPAVAINWFDAIAYCNWRSEREGLAPCYRVEGERDFRLWPPSSDMPATARVECDFAAGGYRLPTEAEWEYAATGGPRDPGDGYGDDCAWGTDGPRGNVADAALGARYPSLPLRLWPGYADGFVFTSPVGSFPSDRLGLFDMSGDISVWCWDYFDPRYYSAPASIDPRGPEGPLPLRSLRGSGWRSPPEELGSSFRFGALPADSSSLVGFRLARSYVDVPRR